MRYLEKGNESVRSLEEVKVTKANRIVEVKLVLYCRCRLSEEGAHKKGKSRQRKVAKK